MIKINIEEGNCRIEHQGDPITVAVEMAAASGGVYTALKTKDGMGAELFRTALLTALMPDSPTWKPDNGIVISVPANKKSGGAPTGQS